MNHVPAYRFSLREPLTLDNGRLLLAGMHVEPTETRGKREYLVGSTTIPAHIVHTEEVTIVDFQVDSDGGLDAVIVDRNGAFVRVRTDLLRATGTSIPRKGT